MSYGRGIVYMKPSVFKKGFKAVKDEVERKEKEKLARKGKLWRFFLKEEEEDVPFRFLTEEPFNYYEHTVNRGGKFITFPCIGDGCKECANKKPTHTSAWLGIDGREIEVDERDANGKATGKKKIIKDQIKILSRGVKTATQLDRLSRKYGLVGIEWLITRTGKSTDTVWNFDRGDENDLTSKQLKAIMAKLPEEIRDLDPEEILLLQLQAEMDAVRDDEDGDTEDDDSAEDLKSNIKSKVQKMSNDDEEDEDEEEEPVKKKPKKLLKKK